MVATLDNILAESTVFYRTQKRELMPRLLLHPKGAVKRRTINGVAYAYLRRSTASGMLESYLGPLNGEMHGRVADALQRAAHVRSELQSVQQALKTLRVPPMERQFEDLSLSLAAIIKAFDAAGLWAEGLELIGSWCFKIYQNHCGVDFYPETTLDADFAIRIPYQGQTVDIPALLRAIGLEERTNYADGTSVFFSSDLQVEFLKHRKGDGRSRAGQDDGEAQLNIRAQALPYLNILLDHPVIIPLRAAGKVAVPCMPAFFLHKLLVAESRTGKTAAAKREKDLRQVEGVAKAILREQPLCQETAAIHAGLHKTWQKKIARVVEKESAVAPGRMRHAGTLLARIGEGATIPATPD